MAKKKSGGKRRMPPALARYWAGKKRGKSKRRAASKAPAKRRRRSAGGAMGSPIRRRSLRRAGGVLSVLADVARTGVGALAGAVASGFVRGKTATLHQGDPIKEGLVSAGTAAALAIVGPKVARRLPIIGARDATAAAVGASMDAAFVATAKQRAAGKLPGVPGDRRGVLAGDVPSPSSGTDVASALLG